MAMKIESINITNYRGLESLSLTGLDKHMNLIVGINGAGKTSILDATSVLFSKLLARMKSSSSKGLPITDSDIRIGAKKPCSIKLTLSDGRSWEVVKARSYSSKKAEVEKSDLLDMNTIAEEIVSAAENGGNIPIIMYYPVYRSIVSVPVKLHKKTSISRISEVYANALVGNADFRTLFEWYRKQEDIENEMIRDDASHRDRCLEVIRRAMRHFYPEYSEMRVRRSPYQAMVVKKDEQLVEFNQLSQGEKCYLSLVCDIARRLAIANPTLVDPLDGEGIIMIDEVDLHLHPKWQSEIVSKLSEVFRNCQFILTTHSAQVLSDAKRCQVIPISNGKLIDIAFNPYGQLTSGILSNYFGMSQQRSRIVADKIMSAFEAIRKDDQELFDSLYSDLESSIGLKDRDMVNLLIEAKRRGMR